MQRRKKITYACLGLAALLSLGARQFPEQAGYLAATFQKEDPLASKAVTLVPDSIESIQVFQVNDGTNNVEITLCGIKGVEAKSTQDIAPHEHLQQLLEKSDGSLAMLSAQSQRNGSPLAEIFVPLPNTEEEIHLNTQLIVDGVAQLDSETVDLCPNAEALHRAADT